MTVGVRVRVGVKVAVLVDDGVKLAVLLGVTVAVKVLVGVLVGRQAKVPGLRTSKSGLVSATCKLVHVAGPFNT